MAFLVLLFIFVLLLFGLYEKKLARNAIIVLGMILLPYSCGNTRNIDGNCIDFTSGSEAHVYPTWIEETITIPLLGKGDFDPLCDYNNMETGAPFLYGWVTGFITLLIPCLLLFVFLMIKEKLQI